MKTLTHFPYQHILVLGLAKSGTSASHLLLDSQKQVRVNDLKADPNSPDIQQLEQKGAEVITGGHPLRALNGIDLVVKNPGIPYENPLIKEALDRDIPVITEVELAGRLHEGSLIGITGSNGKTTTTTLIHEMLASDHQAVSMAGNIGEVACEVARSSTANETMVVELSSFQLLGLQTFRPNIAVWLNLYEAHLDYHKTLENYHQAKANIIKHQTESDYVVYNADDQTIPSFLPPAKGQLVPFSIRQQVEGAWADGQWVYFKDEPIIKKEEIVLVGEQNLQNILAAIAAAKINNSSNEAICDVLRSFTGVAHRLQYVTRKNDRSFYNDSKATNVLATSYALRSFDQPVILLAGGLDRGNNFDSLIPYLSSVKAMVVFGETADLLNESAQNAGIHQVRRVRAMDEAVAAAYSMSATGDVILLSPACASWDQYQTFEERGNMFINAVHKLK